MNPDQLVNGLLTYIVFLFSTTCHEAAHAYVALRGGDRTAADGGQVSLNPLPHIRREPFGMVLLPLLSLMTGGGMIGWASAPYNPEWQRRYPQRAALMALAGPAMNFFLAIVCGLLLRLGLTHSYFRPGSAAEGVETILDIGFYLNLLLGIFNLLPFPPFDGFGALGIVTGNVAAMERFRSGLRQYAFVGLIAGLLAVRYVFPPVYAFASRIFFTQ